MDLAAHVLRHEAAGLLGEVDEDGAGLEHRDGRAAVRRCIVDDRRHAVVGADRQELGLELVALGDVDGEDPVGDARLLDEDRDLVAVGRRPVVQIDHEFASGEWAMWAGLVSGNIILDREAT